MLDMCVIQVPLGAVMATVELREQWRGNDVSGGHMCVRKDGAHVRQPLRKREVPVHAGRDENAVAIRQVNAELAQKQAVFLCKLLTAHPKVVHLR